MIISLINTRKEIVNTNRIINFKEHIKGMSHENLYRYAEEHPIIPVEETKTAMSDNVGYAAAIQNYCTLVNTQPDVSLDGIQNIVPSQNLARENSAYWLDDLNPLVIKVYTQVKQFCNFYGSLTSADIEQIVNNIGTVAGGKEDFLQLMNAFKKDADKNQTKILNLSGNLSDFNADLGGDLRNFMSIKQEADAKYLGQDGKLNMLQQDMIDLENRINYLNQVIPAFAAMTGLGILTILISVLAIIANAPGGIYMLIAGIATTATGGGMLGQAVEEKKQAQHTYQETVIEFEHLQTQCAALQILSDNFNSLGESNLKAAAAVMAMVNAWHTIGNNFEGIAESVQGVVEEETKLIIKLRLKSAIKDVQSLKKFAEDCERNGILPIKTEEKMGQILRLPRSWINQPIEGNVFRSFINSKRRLGFYDRGRRGWQTRDKQILVPCYQREK